MFVEAGDDRGPWDGGHDLGWALCVLRSEDGEVCSRFCLIEDGDVHLPECGDGEHDGCAGVFV